jgi:hypothetical protein
LATSVQIGTVYCLLLWVGVVVGPLAMSLRDDDLKSLRGAVPVGPMLAMVAVPAALVALVVVGFPHLWAGFLEHARQTPSLTGWRWPRPDEILKAVRNTPGILAAAALFGWLGWVSRQSSGASAASPGPESDRVGFGLVGVASTVAALALIGGALFLLTPNSVLFIVQLQPLAVGCCLAWAAASPPGPGSMPGPGWQRVWPRGIIWFFLGLAGLGAIRAVGITTWGAACAVDAGYGWSLRRVRSELDGCAAGNSVVLSSAYLYEGARHGNLRWIHADWLAPARRHRGNDDWQGVLALRPVKIILTQFDYYRRLEPVVARLAAEPGLARVKVVNTATFPAPDSIPRLQKVVQHISWAPVVVEISWK